MISINQLSLDLNGFYLDNINLEVKEGEYFVILGPTGAGKTVLIESIAGLHRIKTGNIRLNGKNITSSPPEERDIGYVPQDRVLFPHLTVEENIAFGLKIRKKGRKKNEIEKKVLEVMNLLNISHLRNRTIQTLSGGEAQRVSLGRAMAINPKLLLLDEPLSALDIRTKEKLCILLKKIHTLTSPKKTFVHITHDFQEAISLGDRIAIMNNGKIVQVGEPYEVFRKPKSVFVANFVGVENLFKGIANNSENGFIKININPKLSFYAIAKKTISPGHVYVSIRPEEIFITKKGCISNSTKNLFQGTVTEVLDRGALLHIKIDIGIPINSIVTRMTYKDMGLNIGSELCVSFKENEVHVF